MKDKEQISYKISRLKEDLLLAEKMHYTNVIKIKTHQISLLNRLKNTSTKKVRDELLLLKDEMESKDIDVIRAGASYEIYKWLLSK
jgi:hypothetical protein